MGLQLIFMLIIKLNLVLCIPQLHQYAATNLHHYRVRSHSSIALPPSESSYSAVSPSKSFSKAPTKKWIHGYVDSPISHHKHHNYKRKFRNQTPQPNNLHTHQGTSVFKSQPKRWNSAAPSPSPSVLSNHLNVPSPSPRISPLASSLNKIKTPPPAYALVLPPPPPNKDCMMMTCSEPLTNTPPGSPCGCVWPLQVKIRMSIAIYKFFPLVFELAEEIAASLLLDCNQVRIVGADAANHQLEKTTVLLNLVPQGVKFDDTTAFLIYKKFWHRELLTDASLFGAYEVLYVHYPGLPPSPPSNPFDVSGIVEPDSVGTDGNLIKPLGVDVSNKKKKEGNGERTVVMVMLSCFAASVLFIGVTWLCLLKCHYPVLETEQLPDVKTAHSFKNSGTARSLPYENMLNSRSTSTNSGTIAYAGSAKIFTLNEIEKATNSFSSSRILGEGGFGLVYKGGLHDGRDVAVKILKRDDRHGSREFLAEVEMLSRLHHRNLVKLIGICIEKPSRCLVYELVPNGSVESHLHGSDKVTGPLDWDARMKIALGAARGLAYLHEDSNPCVIHRDFKSSNILLEDDFTPKVSDFGLARTALDEGNQHISTHVMGTFGYLAPEYAMTGHLLVKSDVYSYGVVLLELLTGRKPVDWSRPPGQECLVAWVRPLLTSKEGLEMIIDPDIKHSISLDSVLKVAAIASMCVQAEVTQRPFMGEVVQALKLVYSEFEETTGYGRSVSFRDDVQGKFSKCSDERVDFSV
ncbi:hypothetical protein PIB30_015237 [Stylosanthes scabra]|uniref:Protein kinase domain-containing protein n=1 Tax=Stylosanthes scabra TaxID=79078 RepID=A0ABU6X677_9FABA|nr:hypothetical protein [Stylosanthes scabra]